MSRRSSLLRRGAVCLGILFAAGSSGLAWAFQAGEILRCNTDGTELEQVLSPYDSLAFGALAVDPDPASRRLYWVGVNVTEGWDWSGFRRATLEGANPETIHTDEGVSDIAIDSVNDAVCYVTSWEGDCEGCGHADCIPMDGSDVYPVKFGDDGMSAIALYPPQGKACIRGEDGIQCGKIDGTDTPVVVAAPARDIAIDPTTGKVYFSEALRIRKMNLDGTELEDVITGLDNPDHIALDPVAGRMWWTAGPAEDTRIQGANLDGSNLHEVLTGLYLPWSIDFAPARDDLDQDKLYIVANPVEVTVEVPATSGWGTTALLLTLLAVSTTALTRARLRDSRRSRTS